MRADLLHVVAAVANPIRWASRITLAKQFIEHMLASGVQLTIVECAYGQRPFELAGDKRFNHVAVRADGSALVWNKEPLLNLGATRLPGDAEYIAFLDADITMRSPTWAADTVHALQRYHVVQPWSNCLDLGPNGELIETHTALFKLAHHKKPIIQGPNAGPNTYTCFGHPGYGYAFRRQTLNDLGGLIETAGLGAADHHAGMALLGRVGDSIPGNMTEGYKAPLQLWQARASRFVAQNVSYVGNVIEHSWHGNKASRAYVSRWDILIKWGFDPLTDLKKNVYGVVELAGNKPGLRHDIDLYFSSRSEDSNTLG